MSDDPALWVSPKIWSRQELEEAGRRALAQLAERGFCGTPTVVYGDEANE